MYDLQALAKFLPSKATTNPSRPNVFKSKIYRETLHWDATLKIDYDTHRNPFSLPRLKRATPALQRMGVIAGVRVDRTKRGHHLRIWLTPHARWTVGYTGKLPAATVLRLHGVLNDDPRRMVFNRIRIRRREPNWNVLWNEKIRNGVVWMREEYDAELTAKAEDALDVLGVCRGTKGDEA
jgi:hypothetical protein